MRAAKLLASLRTGSPEISLFTIENEGSDQVYEPQHEIPSNVVYATSKGSDQPAHQSLGCRLSVKLLTEQHLTSQSLKGGCTGSSESTLVKMPHYWQSHVAAHLCYRKCYYRCTTTSD